MTQELPRGGNASLSPFLGAAEGQLRVRLQWAAMEVAVDVVAFVLAESGKCRGDADMIFYNNPRAADGSLLLEKAKLNTEGMHYQDCRINLAAIPEDVSRVVFALSLENGAIGHIAPVSVHVLDMAGTQDLLFSQPPTAQAGEAAYIMGEIYRRNGEWKFRSVGQGFGQGLAALAENYGLVVAEAAQATLAAQPPSGMTPVAAQSGQRFEKPPFGFGDIQVQLTWNTAPAAEEAPVTSRGLFGGFKKPKSSNIDLDLCCLYELADGYRGIVQALGGHFGTYKTAPYIELQGDERQGSNGQNGETLRINGARWDEVKRILVYAMIFEGEPNWAAAGGKGYVRLPEMVPIAVKLNPDAAGMRACSIAMIINENGNMVVEKLGQPFKNPRELDNHYGWGLRWTAGTKD